SLTRPRSASPTLMLFPEIRRVMRCLEWIKLKGEQTLSRFEADAIGPAAVSARKGTSDRPVTSDRQRQRTVLVAATLHRGRDPHRLAVFRDRATRDINTGFAQSFHDGVVGED